MVTRKFATLLSCILVHVLSHRDTCLKTMKKCDGHTDRHTKCSYFSDAMQISEFRVAHFSRVVELFFVLNKTPTSSGSNRDFSLSVLKIKKIRGSILF
jgi:hypothetical protein